MIWRRRETALDPLSGYAERLLRLHQLIDSGEGDSLQADRLRDEMDAPWHNLTSAQVRLIDGLSEDLYSSSSPGDFVAAESSLEFKQAVEDEDWETALVLIRRARLEPQDFLRGVCWAQVGQPRVAAEFFDRAARSGVLTPDQEVWRLGCFVLSGRSLEVLNRARDILSHENDPLLRFTAGQVLFDLATKGFVEHQEAIQATCQTLDLVKQLPAENCSLPSSDVLEMQRGALLHLALSFDELGDRDAANKACQDALKISADDMNALLLLGWLTAESSIAEHDSLRGKLRRILMPIELSHFSAVNT